MDWIYKSNYYTYLKGMCDFEPKNNDEIIFKRALCWALLTMEQQAESLSKIEASYSTDFCTKGTTENKTFFKVIKGGKNNN